MIFTFCAAIFCVLPARGDDVEIARAAARSIASASQQSPVVREQRTNIQTKNTTPVSSGRTNMDDVSVRTAAPRTSAVASRTAVSALPREVSTRPATTTPTVASRSAITPGQNLSITRNGIQSSPVRFDTPVMSRSTTISRAAVSAARAIGAPTSGYKFCRETFFQCMDEFCANKNAQLKRCACSARVHDFDNIRKTLDEVEQKMLDFNERLLAVSMDKEDATAMSSATEGEKAFATDDKSESKSILDGIMKKLQSANADTANSNSLAAISLSMDTNVFDTIDSDLGIETTSKEGEDLYNAALPTCLEMATEVCGSDEVSTAQNAYVAAIEQDCNTVSKTYTSLKDKAVEKVREGGALLEMSRLNNQQTRNADDILVCKKKMLDALTDSAVCGENLGKCLDWSGKFINPLTGSAILTSDLTKLDGLIRRPTGDEKWAQVTGNDKFVTFLGAKKKYIEPAMKNCEGLESDVWTAFLEDALAQIKLAQGKKLEDMRQSCTTLTTECMNNAASSLVDFDSRALSVFGVYYDKNVNQVCSQIKNACTALINNVGTDSSWGDAIANISTTKTLDQIITTCTEVGKNCIIRNCMNLESKFGLCQSRTSIMRSSILNQGDNNPCWDEVKSCIAATGDSTISKIMTSTGRFGTPEISSSDIVEIFNGAEVYRRNSASTSVGSATGIYLWCAADMNSTTDLCRITERVWGNCTDNPTLGTGTILQSGLQSDSLLSWLATNTNTSCNGSVCEPGQILSSSGCAAGAQLSSDMSYCPMTPLPHNRFNVIGTGYADYGDPDTSKWSNCCTTAQKDGFGSCCASMATLNIAGFAPVASQASNAHVCKPSGATSLVFVAEVGNDLVFCSGTLSYSSDTITCTGGKLIFRNKNTGIYSEPVNTGLTCTDCTESTTENYYNKNITESKRCVYDYAGTWAAVNDAVCNISNPIDWHVSIGN